MNPESISQLIEANRYNIDILDQLEKYVQHQVDTKTYHQEANQTVLKFYQFHPERTQKMIVGKILVKALMNLPSTDFLLASYLIPENLFAEEPIKILAVLSDHLETCAFPEFWTESKACRELLDAVHGFDDAIRGYIISVITQTYKTISKESLSSILNLKGNDLDALVTARGWSQTSDSVTFPRPQDNSNVQKKPQGVKLDDLSRILKTVTK